MNIAQTDSSVQDLLYLCLVCNTTINWDFSANPNFECPICDNTTYSKVKPDEIINNDDSKINDSIPNTYINKNNDQLQEEVIIEEEKMETPNTKKKKNKKKKRTKKLNNIYICNNCSTRVQIDEFEGYEIFCPECNCTEFTKEGGGDTLTNTITESITETLTDTLTDTIDENTLDSKLTTDDTKENDNPENKLSEDKTINNNFNILNSTNIDSNKDSNTSNLTENRTKETDLTKDKIADLKIESSPEPLVINDVIDKGKRILYKCTKCDKVSYIFQNLLLSTKCERCSSISWQNLDEDNDDSDVDDDLSDDDFKLLNNKSEPSINKSTSINNEVKTSDNNNIIVHDDIKVPDNIINKPMEINEVDADSDGGNPFDDDDTVSEQIKYENKSNSPRIDRDNHSIIVNLHDTDAQDNNKFSGNNDTTPKNDAHEITSNDIILDDTSNNENIDGELPDDGIDYDSYIDSLIDKQLGINLDVERSIETKKDIKDIGLKSESTPADVNNKIDTVVELSINTEDTTNDPEILLNDEDIHLSDDEQGDEILDMFLNKYGDDDIKKALPIPSQSTSDQPHITIEKKEQKPLNNDDIKSSTRNKVGSKRLTLAEMKKQLHESVLEEIKEIDDKDLIDTSKLPDSTSESLVHIQNIDDHKDIYRGDKKYIVDQNTNNNEQDNNNNQIEKTRTNFDSLSDKNDDQVNIIGNKDKNDNKKESNTLFHLRDNTDSDGQKKDENKFLRQSLSINVDKPKFDFQSSKSRDITRTIPSLSFKDILDADEEETAALKKTITLQSCKPKPPNLHDAPDKVRILNESTPLTQSKNEPHNPFDNDETGDTEQNNFNENPFDDKKYLSQSTRIQPSQSVNTELIEEAELKLAQSTRVIGHLDPFSSVRSQPVRRVGTRTKYFTMDLNDESQSNSFIKQMITGIPAVKFCRWGPSHKTVLRFIEDPGKRVLLQWERKKYFRKTFASIYFDEITLIRDDQGKRITFITPKRVLEIEFDSPQSKKKYYEDFMSIFNIGGNP